MGGDSACDAVKSKTTFVTDIGLVRSRLADDNGARVPQHATTSQIDCALAAGFLTCREYESQAR